jgi:hypothetical protein
MKQLSLVLALIAAVLAGCATRTAYTDLYGTPASPSVWADRTIPIGPNTKYVNVEGGQIIRFVVGEKSFAWHFMVARTVNHFDLREVAPPGTLDHSVIAYVTPDPRYIATP